MFDDGVLSSTMQGWWRRTLTGYIMACYATRGHCVRAVVDDFGDLIRV